MSELFTSSTARLALSYLFQDHEDLIIVSLVIPRSQLMVDVRESMEENP